MTRIDALGQPCPIPVVKAKTAIAALPAEGGVVEVLVDNQVACENLAKMATGSGHGHTTQTLPDGNFLVAISVGAGRPATAPAASPEPSLSLPQSGAGLAAAIGCDSMGHGSEELGRILIKGFIFSLSQLDPVPQAALFFNSGVRLVLDDANTVEDLRALAAKGCRILVCGTCVDYYQVKDRVAVGEVTNMYGIVEAMNAARSVVSI